MTDIQEVQEIHRARDFAIAAHGSQMYGVYPYWRHLSDVVRTAFCFLDGMIDAHELYLACWLHDTLEDTEVTREDIEREFGPRVAELVAAVTCVKGLPRKEKFKEAYPRIRATKGAVLVKLADRIANVTESTLSNRGLYNMYLREYPEFRHQLRDPTDVWAAPMWAELDRLFNWL